MSNTAIAISFQLSRPKNSDSEIAILVHISNNTSDLITEYAFHVAVSKVDFSSPIYHSRGRLTLSYQGFSLRLTPQSGRILHPLQKNAIAIPIEINGVAKGQANSVKMRWKASYKVAGDLRQEQGDVPTLGIV